MPLSVSTFLLTERRSYWRPTELPDEAIEECLSPVLSVPFSPALKSEKMQRACDFTFWTAQKNLAAQRDGRTGMASAMMAPTAENTKDSEFTLVDSSKLVKAKSRFARRPRPTPAQQQAQRQQQQAQQKLQMQQRQQQQRFQQRPNFSRGGKKDKLGAAYQQTRNQQQNSRWSSLRARAVAAECAVEIAPEWQHMKDILFSALSGLSVAPKDIEISDLEWRGQCRLYNPLFDRITPRAPKELGDSYCTKFSIAVPQAQSDQVLATALEEREDIQVILTDQVLAAIMSAPQSKYAWQITCYRIEGKLIMDKPEGSNLDILTINETSSEPAPAEGGLKPRSLVDIGMDAARSNLEYSQMVVEKQPIIERHGDLPFIDGEEVAPGMAYRYRTVKLPPLKPVKAEGGRSKSITLAVRCQVNAALQDNEGNLESYVAVHALNEGTGMKSAPGWAVALEKQKGTLLATELRNNACKVTRWIYSAMMAGCSQLKLGFIARRHDKHTLLAVQTHRVNDLAAQIGLKPSNAWGIVRELIDIIMSDMNEDGVYIVTRDSLQPQIKLHYKPLDGEELDGGRGLRDSDQDD